MNRRNFLKTLGAAFCGAMLCTFPDFGGGTAPTVVAGSVLSAGIHDKFMRVYKRQYAAIQLSMGEETEDDRGETFGMFQ